jgi:hypothetical protein
MTCSVRYHAVTNCDGIKVPQTLFIADMIIVVTDVAFSVTFISFVNCWSRTAMIKPFLAQPDSCVTLRKN